MKLVNTSSKVISVGEILLMPDKEAPVNKKVANLPSVKAFVELGFIRIDNGDELDAEKKAADEAEAKAKAEAEAKAKAEAEAEAAKKAEDESKKKADAEAKAAKASK